MYKLLKNNNNILKKEALTKCCGAKQGFHKGKWICFCCGMPLKKNLRNKK